ncbi:NAD(P)-dependent oxidoreductase [Chloroflexota bacterium]
MSLPSVQTIRVLCAEPQNYSESALETIASFAELDAVTLSQEQFDKKAVEYGALMVRLQLCVTEGIMKEATRLRAILSPTTGLDHIDIGAAESCNVKVFSLHEELAFLREVYSTAEHTFALLLSLIRKIPSAAESVKQGQWQPYQYRGRELHGKTLGIVGCGRLGTMVCRYGLAFGMRVIAYDPYTEKLPQGVRACDSLASLLKESDILSIHVPLNKETERMIGKRELSLLPRGALLVNTSRGAILDEGAVLDNLKQGRLSGAAFDVLANEHQIPSDGHPLISYAKEHSNVIITPHIAGAAEEAIEKADMFVIQNFRDWCNKVYDRG